MKNKPPRSAVRYPTADQVFADQPGDVYDSALDPPAACEVCDAPIANGRLCSACRYDYPGED